MRFRKKPVEIEAVQFEYTDEGIERLKQFCGTSLGIIRKARHPDAKAEAEIGTLEDGSYLKVEHFATEGDWVIRGIQGEYYPCKPDIFEATYEPIDKIPMTLADLIKEEQDRDRLSY